MKQVRALQTGFYGGMRQRAGTIFEVEDNAKAGWFTPVGGEADVKAQKARAQKAEPKAPTTLADAAGTKGKSQAELLKEQGKDSHVAQTGADLA